MSSSNSKAIHLPTLRKALGFDSSKLPLDAEGIFCGIQCYNSRGEPTFKGDITVVKSSLGPDSCAFKHRIFVTCCNRLIPAGRYHQHIKAHVPFTTNG